MSYHARDGLFFGRHREGGVIVTFEVPVRDGAGNYADGHRTVLNRIELSESEWASVVASVSAGGETGERFAAARAFHSDRDGGTRRAGEAS